MEMLKDADIQSVRILEDVYKGWEPNEGQIKAGKALFHHNQRTLFIRWGRKGGKTEFIVKAIYRWALLNPRAGCYYFCPQANQAREILWETGRLQTAVPRKYIKKIKSNDMRIILVNDSFIKLDGSDNYEKHRGTEPHFLAYDEFKDFDRRFHEAIDPNRGVYDAPLIIIGTPPVSINDDRNYEQYIELQTQCARDDDKFFLKLPSYVNRHNIPKPKPDASMEERIAAGEAYLAKKRQELIDRGEEYRWLIEYMAEDVAMGKNAVFPMLNETDHVVDHNEVIEMLRKDQHKLEWYCLADPASSTVFGVLFICLNPYTREFWILDEIYESDRSEMTTRKMNPKIVSKMRELAPALDPEDDWIKVCDEAAAWYMNESLDQVDKTMCLSFAPTDKNANKKEDGLSLIKDTLIYGFCKFTERVVKDRGGLYWEMRQYTCQDGKYPKNHDHQIDNFRYFIADCCYNMMEALEAKKEFRGSRRLTSEEDLFDGFDDLMDDWTDIYD